MIRIVIELALLFGEASYALLNRALDWELGLCVLLLTCCDTLGKSFLFFVHQTSPSAK